MAAKSRRAPRSKTNPRVDKTIAGRHYHPRRREAQLNERGIGSASSVITRGQDEKFGISFPTARLGGHPTGRRWRSSGHGGAQQGACASQRRGRSLHPQSANEGEINERGDYAGVARVQHARISLDRCLDGRPPDCAGARGRRGPRGNHHHRAEARRAPDRRADIRLLRRREISRRTYHLLSDRSGRQARERRIRRLVRVLFHDPRHRFFERGLGILAEHGRERG